MRFRGLCSRYWPSILKVHYNLKVRTRVTVKVSCVRFSVRTVRFRVGVSRVMVSKVRLKV